MKKIIRIFFIISLVCFSFFYTDKVMNLLNSKDPLMVKLNNIKKDYEVLPVNAIIDKCTNHKVLGFFGEETVNVLKVNLMLDKII